MHKIGITGVIMAALCANISRVMGATRGRDVGRVAINARQIQIKINRQSGHITTRSLSSTAFISLSPPEQRIKNNHDRHHQKQQLIRPFHSKNRSSTRVNDADTGEFYANPESFPDFGSLGITSSALLKRLTSKPLRLERPSAVQAAVFETISAGDNNVIIGAETGSGKTLAYLMPLVEDILKRKREWKAKMAEGGDDAVNSDQVMDPGYDYARAVILVPNKELAHQAVRMAASICGGLDRCVVWGADALGMDYNQVAADEDVPEEEIVRLALLPGGLSAPQDFPPFRFATSTSPNHQRQPPPDLVFATPANLGPFALSPKNIDLFADISTVVVDEADMLLDGGYIQQLNNVMMGFRRADRLTQRYGGSVDFRRKSDIDSEGGSEPAEEDEGDKEEDVQKKTQHIFVAATLPDYGLRSVDAYLHKKFPDALSITMAGMHNARHYGLEDGSQTVWDELADNKDRMKRIVDVLMLDRDEVGVDGRGLKGEKVMMFLNTVKDVDGATNGLRRAGINAVPYHAKISLEDRTSNLDKFRRYRAPTDDDDETTRKNAKDTVPVLVCTDMASRGLDIPGVTAIVQLQFALNVVNHLHRMGRCGRAGNRDGRGIIFYGPKERELVEVVREAEQQQSRMTLKQDVEDDKTDDGEGEMKGKVQNAFSRKRGFTKKRKKQRKKDREEAEDALEYE